MPQIIDVDGIGPVEFPDGMSREQMEVALKKLPKPKQTLYTEDTIYDAASGMPLSSPAYGSEATGATKVAQKALTTAAGLPVNYAMGAAKNIAGPAQFVGKMMGSQLADEPVKAINQIERGVNQNSYAPVTQGASIVGEVFNPLTAAVGNKAFSLAGKVPMPPLPSYAQNLGNLLKTSVGAGASGAATTALSPTETGLNLPEYLNAKASDVVTSGMINAALPVAGKAITTAAKPVGRAVSNVLSEGLGLTTGVGGEPIRQAFRAGVEGGDRGRAFAANLRGKTDQSAVLEDVATNLENMGRTLQQEYRSGMAKVGTDKTVLAFDKIDDALGRASKIGKYGTQTTNQRAADAVQEVQDIVAKWKRLDPAMYHTPEGMDALKKQIYSVMEGLPFEQSTARKAVGEVYGAVRREIARQAPIYDKVMRDYNKGSELLSEIRKTFSQTGKASADTQMRKLQSLMRNNVQTNYGNRQRLMDILEQQGGTDVMPSLAGQALSSPVPRGLANKGAELMTLGASFYNPALAATLPFQTPRLVGEAVYGAGKAARPVVNLANSVQLTPKQLNLARLLAIKASQQGE